MATISPGDIASTCDGVCSICGGTHTDVHSQRDIHVVEGVLYCSVIAAIAAARKIAASENREVVMYEPHGRRRGFRSIILPDGNGRRWREHTAMDLAWVQNPD